LAHRIVSLKVAFSHDTDSRRYRIKMVARSGRS
jgi:hypothetical protein